MGFPKLNDTTIITEDSKNKDRIDKANKIGNSDIILDSPYNKQMNSNPLIELGGLDISGRPTKFGESKYDTPDISINDLKAGNLDYIRAERQSNWAKAANGILKATAKIVPRTVEGIVNPIYGSLDALFSWDKSKLWDNAVVDAANNTSDALEKALPLYTSKEAQNAHGFDKLLYANTYFGDILDGISYSASALLSGGAYTKAIGLLGKTAAAGKLADYLGGLKSIENSKDAISYVTKWDDQFKTQIVGGLNKGVYSLIGASTEASDNARSDSQEWMANMTKELTHDGQRELTQGEKEWLDVNRKSLGNSSYILNLPVIMADNWLTFGKTVLSKKAVEKEAFKDVADKVLYNTAEDTYYAAKKSKIDKILDKTYGLRKAFKTAIPEGLQETEQLGVAKGVQDYYTKKYYNPDAASFVDSFGKGWDAALTKEGLDNFLIGAISAGVFGNATTMIKEGKEGYTNQDDKHLNSTIDFLNKSKSSPIFQSMVDAMVRHNNLSDEQDVAAKEQNDFEYMNKASDLLINHINSKLKTGKLDDFRSKLNEFSALTPDQFEQEFGIKLGTNELTGVKNSVHSFIEPKLKASNKIEALYNSINNIAPNATEGLKDRLLYAAYSLEDSYDRSNELNSKVNTKLTENLLKYNQGFLTPSGTVINPSYNTLSEDDKKLFKRQLNTLEINPVDKADMIKLVADIDKLNERKTNFIKEYKALQNPVVQKIFEEADKEAKKKVDEELAKQIKEESTPETLNDLQDVKTTTTKETNVPSSTSPEIQSIVDKLKANPNYQFTDLDEIDLYEKNQDQIDNLVKQKEPEDSEETINEETVEINSSTTDNSPIISAGKKALTSFKSNNGVDDGTRPVANRWYNWMRTNKLSSDNKFLIVTKSTNSKLYKELLAERGDEKDTNGLNPREFEFKYEKDNKKEYPGTYLVIVNKEGNPIKSERGYLQTTLTKNTGNVIVSPEENIQLNKLRNDIQSLKEGNHYLQITGKSKGHPEFIPKIDNKRQSINVEDSFRPISKIEIYLPTIALSNTPGFGLIKGQRVEIGKAYIFGESGNLYDLVPRKLNVQEIDRIFDLIKEENEKEIQKLIYFGIPKSGIKPYTIGIKNHSMLFMGNDWVSLTDLNKPEIEQQVKDFLVNKFVNINKNYGFNDEFTDIFGNMHNSYKEYLLGKDTQLFGTDLKPRGEIQLRNQYLTFDPNIKQDKVKLVSTAEDFFSGSQFAKADDYSTQEEVDETTPIKPDIEVKPIILATDKKADIERRRKQSLEDLKTQEKDPFFTEEDVIKDINSRYNAELASLEKSKTEIKTNDLNIDFSKGQTQSTETPKIIFDKKLSSLKEGKHNPLTQEEINDVKRMLPNVSINIIQGLIEGESLGRMISNSQILLSDLAVEGVGYHEAFHWVSQVLLTEKERETIYNEIRNRIGNQKLTNEQVEEQLADDFANYKSTGEILKQSPKRNSLFRRILSILRDFFNLKAKDVQTVYERLNKGFYSKSVSNNPNSKESFNKAFEGKTELFTKEILDGLDKEFFDTLFANGGVPDVIFRGSNKRKLIDSLFTQATKDKGASGTLLSKQNALREKYLAGKTTEEENKTLASYNYILSNWANVVNKWNERLSSMGFIEKLKEKTEDEVLQELENGENGRQGEAFQEANQVSTLSTVSKSSKLLIRSLPALNPNGSIKKNSAGLEQLVDFGHTYNYLLRELSGTSNDYSKIYEKIESLILKHPEFRILLDRLGEPSVNNSFDKQWMINQFTQDFTKNQLFSYITIMNKNGEHYLINANTQAIAERVKDSWKSQSQIIGKLDETSGKLKVSIEGLPKPGKFTDNIKFLEAIGINFSPETLEVIKDSDEFERAVHVLYNKIIIDKGDITDLYNSKYDEAGNIKTLVDLESSNNNDIPELSVINATGKSVYSMGNESYLSQAKNAINNAKTLQELVDELPHLNSVTVKNSIYLKRLFDSNGNRRKGITFDLDLNSGLNSESDDNTNKYKKDTRQLTIGEKFLQDITNVLTTGKSTFLRPSDKSTDLLTGISDWGKGQKLIIPIESVKEGFNTPRIREIFKGYLTDEINRITEFKLNNQGTDVIHYQTNGGKFATFKDFSFDKESIYKEIEAEKDINEIIEEHFEDFFKGVNTFFGRKSSHLASKLAELQVPFAKNLTSKYSEEELVRAASINDYINTIEQSKLFFGDPAFYKDLFKRTGGAIGQKQSLAIGEVINGWLNTNNKRADGKEANDKINVLVYDDVKVKSDYFKEYTDALVKSGLSQEEAESLLEPFTKMDEGDAQGWIALSEYREFALRLGDINFWSKSHEAAYDKVIKGEQLTPEELVLFKVLKAQYFGPQDYKNNTLFAPAYHKFSLMPLFPQLVDGRNLSKLYEHMTNTQTGYALFGSGSKVGTIVDNEGKSNQFYTHTNNGEINTTTPINQIVNYRWLGLQVKTSEAHDHVIFGTQFRKLIMSNLYNKGKAVEWASPLFEEYNQIISNIVDNELKGLVKELGLDPINYTAKNVKDLVKLVKEEAKGRTLPDNVVDQIQELNGQLRYKFDASVVKSKIDNLLMSLVNSRVIRQYMNGDSLVQGASSGFEQLGVRKVGTNPAFKFYSEGDGETNAAECGIPMSKNYYSLFAKYNNDLDRLNEAISNGEIDEKILTLIGYRIPTQGLNSMDFFKIKQFLPETSGAMILPTEIVAKSGGDYDIDKMNIFRPYLTENGEYKTNDNNRLIEISHEILSHQDNFTSLITPNSTHILTDVVDDMRYIEYVNKKKEDGENPLPFKVGTKESGGQTWFDNFKKQQKNVKYSDQFDLVYKIEQFQKFMLAKDMIGIAAIANTSHTIAQIYNWSINITYGVKKNKYVDIKFSHNQNDDRTISIADVMDSENVHKISEIISQIINATVDAAKDPFLFDLNMNLDTLGVYIYLLKAGVRFENIAYMMKQPIITEYLQQLSINKSGYLTAFGKEKKPQIIKNELLKKYNDKLNTKTFDNRKFTNFNDLRNNLLTENQTSQQFYQDQIQVLNDFLKYKEQATLLLNAVSAINHDTNGLGENLGAAEAKEEQVASAFEDGFVNGLQETLDKSFIGKMNLHKTAQEMYGQFYYTQQPEFKEVIKNVEKEINPFKAQEKIDLNKLIVNDLINFVIQNWGFIDSRGESKINDLKKNLFTGDNSIAKRLLAIKTDKNPTKEVKEQQDNLIVKELFSLINSLKGKNIKQQQDNIKLFSRRLDTFTSNSLTQSFRELYDLNPELTRDIYRLGVLQSGLNNSAITYLGLIPYEYYNELVKTAFDNFNKKNWVENLKDFKALFISNNTNNPSVRKYLANMEEEAGVPWFEFTTILGNNQFGKDYELNAFDKKQENTKEDKKAVDEFFAGSQFGEGDIEDKNNEQGSKIDSNLSENDILNSTVKNKTDVELLKEILIHKNSSEYQKELATILLPLSLLNPTKFGIQKDDSYAGTYNKETGALRLNEKTIKESGKNKIDIILHEILHKFTVQPLLLKEQYLTEIDKKYRKQITNLYEFAKSKKYNGQYGFTNVQEFITEAFTNKDFQKLLAELKYTETKPFLSKLYDIVKNYFKDLLIANKKELEEYYKLEQVPEDMAKEWLDSMSNSFDESVLARTLKNTLNYLEQAKEQEYFGKPIGKKISTVFSEKLQGSKIEKEEPKQLSPQEQFLYRRISTLIKLISQEKNEKRKEKQEAELYFQQNKLNQLNTLGVNSDDVFLSLGKHSLEVADRFITSLESGSTLNTEENVNYINDVLDVWRDYPELESDTARLARRMVVINDKELLKNVNENLTNKEKPTLDDIKKQRDDFRTYKTNFGSLIDSSNYIVAAIGSIINKVQSILETKKNKFHREGKELIEKLEKSSGRDIQSIYNELIHHNTKNDTYSLKEETFLNGAGGVSKEAREFYDWYTTTMKDLIDRAPILLKNNILGEKEVVHLDTNFIPNVKKTDWKDVFKRLDPRKEIKVNNTTRNEEQKSDAIPIDFIHKIAGSEKSLDLAHSLYLFKQSIDNYDEMSKALPKIRILQRQIEKTEYKQASNPSITKTGQQSNVWKMVDGFVNAQVKGEYKKEEGKFKYDEYINAEGEKIAKVIDVTSIIDNSIRWNSLLRIGAAPIAAISNVAWGKLSNMIEAWAGGYGKELRQAETILWKQIFNKDSVLNKELLLNLNILQELNDYEYAESLKSGKFKTISGEKLMEYMFSLQKGGEKYIQSSMLLAIMLKDGYINTSGELTEKYKNASNEEKHQLSNKVQRTNHILHGRYSPKEAGIAQQKVMYRAIFQFRKWIHSGVESRLDLKHYDQRLQKDIEGRWVTFAHMITNLKDSIERIKSGELEDFEKYNMKKNLVEAIVAISALVAIGFANSGDDEDKKKRRKNAAFKATMLLLNRVSGDASFFFSPEQINNLGKNAIPVTKLYSDLIDLALYSDSYWGGELSRSFFKKDNKFKSGNKKDLYRLPSKLLDITPGSKLGMDAFSIFNKNPLDPTGR